jgi:hypothetical protein
MKDNRELSALKTGIINYGHRVTPMMSIVVLMNVNNLLNTKQMTTALTELVALRNVNKLLKLRNLRRTRLTEGRTIQQIRVPIAAR